MYIQLLICVAFVCSLLQPCRCNIALDDEYLPIPKGEEIAEQWSMDVPVTNVLINIRTLDSSISEARFRNELRRKKEAASMATEQKVYRALIRLTDTATCTPEMAQYWLSVYIRLAPSDEWIRNYVEKHAKVKFPACARKIEDYFVDKSSKHKFSFEATLDQYVKSVLGFRSEPTEEELIQKAKEFKLSSAFSGWNGASQLLKAAKKNGFAGDDIGDFFDGECEHVRDALGDTYDIINLARALGWKLNNRKLVKFNEYYRIFCISPQKADIRKKLGRD